MSILFIHTFLFPSVMMKSLILSLLLPGVLLPAAAQTTAPDTLVQVNEARHVVLTATDSLTELTIEGRRGDPSYVYHYRMDRSAASVSQIRQQADRWNFSLPLRRSRSQRRWDTDINFGGFAMGFATAFGLPDGAGVNMGSSLEYMLHLIELDLHNAARRHHFRLGFGLHWKNYRLAGRRRFLKSGTDVTIAPYPDGADIRYSRLHVFGVNFPLRYEYNFTRDLSAYAGAIVNFNTYATLKTRYRDALGQNVKELGRHIHQRRATVDVMAGITYRWFGAYVKYSPCPVLDTAFGPRLTSLSTGITLFY